MTLEATGERALCVRVIDAAPAMARRYCHFLTSHEVIGFSWTPVDLAYACPAGMENAPNDTTGYCLYRDVSPPPGVEPACDDFETTGALGFSFPCDR